MIHAEVLRRLFNAFPKAIINYNLEFVANPNSRVNSYFSLRDCNNQIEIVAKVIEYLSREACKSQHYSTYKKNKEVWEYHLSGINCFCDTAFTFSDMEKIYCYLGNGINHQKTLKFIQAGYDLNILEDK